MDVRRLLEAMKLTENSDAAAHVSEMEAHFRLMQERVDELATIGDPVNARTHFQIALKSIPESYHATVQTIDTADTLNGGKTTAEEVITIFLREARHRVILKAETKAGEALAAYANSNSKSKGGDSGKAKKRKPKCFNCNKLGHKSKDCFAPGGGKEGQGPHQMNQKSQKGGKPENSTSSANVASHSEATKEGGTMFAFSATSSFHCIAAKLGIPAERRSAILDSGASHHYCPDKSKFKNLEPISDSIKLADGHTLPALGIGDVEITLPNGDKRNKVMLRKCVYAPDMAFTLISIICITLAGASVIFKGNFCTILHPDESVIAKVAHTDGLYRLSANVAETINDDEYTLYANAARRPLSLFELHCRLGHIHYGAIKDAIRNGLVEGLEIDPKDANEQFCEACAAGKPTTQPFPKESLTRASDFGERVHWDLWGPASVKSLGGKSYAAVRKDDATRMVKPYFLAKKSETFSHYKEDEAWILNHGGKATSYARFDRGGEFLSNEFTQHLKQRGTQRELTVHDSPPQNGVSERGMRTRGEATRTLLIASGLPRYLWAEAMAHACWIQNRTPTRALDGKTPYEMMTGRKPNLTGIQRFGAAAYVKLENAGKLEKRASKARFVGYDNESKGYRIYWPEKHVVSIERNVVFNPGDSFEESDRKSVV